MIQHGRLAMVPQNRNVGAMNRTAHVQAAGQRYAQLGRQFVILEVIKEHVHGGLDRPGGIGGRCVAVDPALGVHDIGDGCAGSANRELEAAGVELAAFKIFDQRIDFLLVGHHKFDVVAGGKPHIAVTMLFRNFADLPDVGGAHKPHPAAAHRPNFVAGFGHMHQNAGFDDVMIQPFAFVFGNDRRIKFVVFSRTDISYPIFHRFVRIVT